MKPGIFLAGNTTNVHGNHSTVSQDRLMKRTSVLASSNAEIAESQSLTCVRNFMDGTESCLLDAILSTRIVNPEKVIFELHFACAEV
jgi:hypothetical protein